jgi:uncharacterized protein
MPIVRVKENEPFDVALRRFKRAVEKTGLLTELRAREFYEKPTAERKRKHAAAVKRRAGPCAPLAAVIFRSPPMPLREQLTEDMKTAMKAREAEKLGAVRLILAAVKQREVDERITLDDPGVIAVIEKMIKQRKDSISQFEKAARKDLADKEKFELGILEAYLPKQLSQAEVDAIIAEAVAASGAKSPSDMGKVMALVKPKLAGRADMGKVSGLVKGKLTG